MSEPGEDSLSEKDKAIRRGIVGSLRAALAPTVGTPLIEVGLKDLWEDIYHDFIEITRGTTNGSMVYIMGEYGQGKTFLCNYTREKVWSLWSEGFATSYVEVKGFESLADYVDIYRQIVKNVQLPYSNKKGVGHLLKKFTESIDSRQALDDALEKMNVEEAFAQKVKFFYRYKGYEDAQTALIRWINAEKDIKAEWLHYIAEKGWAKIEDNDVDDYLTGIKNLVKSMGYEGLFVFIDEAEERTRGYADEVVRQIFRNIKRLHNNVIQDERFCQMIFLLAGTRDLWVAYERLDEAQRQRMHAVRRDLPRLSRENFIELSNKVIRVYDETYDESLSKRISATIIEEWVDFIMSEKSSAGPVTPRDFLSQNPTPRKSFVKKLDKMHRNPDLKAEDVFQLK